MALVGLYGSDELGVSFGLLGERAGLVECGYDVPPYAEDCSVGALAERGAAECVVLGVVDECGAAVGPVRMAVGWGHPYVVVDGEPGDSAGGAGVGCGAELDAGEEVPGPGLDAVECLRGVGVPGARYGSAGELPEPCLVGRSAAGESLGEVDVCGLGGGSL